MNSELKQRNLMIKKLFTGKTDLTQKEMTSLDGKRETLLSKKK